MKIGIIGAGPGGYAAAVKAAQLGAEVVIIEDTEVGGTCLNRGCIPTKTILASTELYAKLRDMDKFGIELKGEVVLNIEKIMERKRKVINTQINGIRTLFRSWGIELKKGRGKFLSPDLLAVEGEKGTEEIKVDKVIIATGASPAELPIFPFDGKNILSSTDALELNEVPESLLIIGAGVMGCEFACIFNQLGTEVTMVEMLPRAVYMEDEEISAILERELKKRRIKLFKEVKVERVEIRNDGIRAFLSNGKEVVTKKVLVSIGRSFNTKNIGLEVIGTQIGQKGEIKVDEKMMTSVEGVYAIGDVIDGMLLAHVASKEGIIAAKNAMGADEKIDYSVVPAAIFTSPEIASVGLREYQAKEQGINYITGHFQFRALGKAHAIGEISGLIKVIADKKTDKVLGVHIIGPHASDLIHEAAVAIKASLSVKDVAETIHAHPTLSEGLMEAFEDVHGNSIHAPKKRR